MPMRQFGVRKVHSVQSMIRRQICSSWFLHKQRRQQADSRSFIHFAQPGHIGALTLLTSVQAKPRTDATDSIAAFSAREQPGQRYWRRICVAVIRIRAISHRLVREKDTRALYNGCNTRTAVTAHQMKHQATRNASKRRRYG